LDKSIDCGELNVTKENQTNKKHRMKNIRSGFTLIELLVAMGLWSTNRDAVFNFNQSRVY
jgi:hypothetical protein